MAPRLYPVHQYADLDDLLASSSITQNESSPPAGPLCLTNFLLTFSDEIFFFIYSFLGVAIPVVYVRCCRMHNCSTIKRSRSGQWTSRMVLAALGLQYIIQSVGFCLYLLFRDNSDPSAAGM